MSCSLQFRKLLLTVKIFSNLLAESLRDVVLMAVPHFVSKGMVLKTLKAEKIIFAIESALEEAGTR